MDIFVPILKVDAAKREVYGVMAEEAKDRANEIFDYASSKPYVQAWSEGFDKTTDGKSQGNVRGQHGKIAAGKIVSITFDDDAKRIPVVAKIVDNNEWEKVVQGVYTGFSIGGSYVKRWVDGATTRYTAKPSEVSIVDNPCMYGATFTMVKADGGSEYRGFAGASSRQSNELAELRVQLNAQFAELLSKLNGLVERRAAAPRPASFQPQGQETATVLKFVAGMPGGVILESDVADAARQQSTFVTKTASGEVVAHTELQKALANGKRVTSPNYTRADDGLEKDAPARFHTVESVAPGVQQSHNMPGAPNVERAFTPAPAEGRPFQPNGETDLNKAHAAVRDALSKGERVGA